METDPRSVHYHLNKAIRIYEEAGGWNVLSNKFKEFLEKDLDPFHRERKKLGRFFKEIRDHIALRDQLLKENSGSVERVKASSLVTTEKSEYKKRVQSLHLLIGEDQVKREWINILYKNLEELNRLERRPHIKPGKEEIWIDIEPPKENFYTFPDVENDACLTSLKNQDSLIDKKLELISDQVHIIKHMALEIGKEIGEQEEMIDVLTKKTSLVEDSLDNINGRLKNVLDKQRKPTRFIIDVILIVLLLSLVAFIYQMVTHK